VAERDVQVISLQQTVAEGEANIGALTRAAAERDGQIANLNQVVAERDVQVISLQQTVAEGEANIGALTRAAAERDGQIANLNQVMAERDVQVISLQQTVAEHSERISLSEQEILGAKREVAQVLVSNSWLITNPLRVARREGISKPYLALRKTISDVTRNTWHWLPISSDSKRKIKDNVFGNFPWLFSWTTAYRAWRNWSAPVRHSAENYLIQETRPIINTSEYVPLINANPLENKPARVICFYLPQYHPIPENNEWWGEGFTEWTNVKPAKPQFEGHYQPHIPGELGYYNLLDGGVQRRQVELAKIYGVEGFCFYFYWFGGKRLLEAPLENYLMDTSLDLPFCLCWANENWSRRWDGLDSEVLIAQQHSADDDIAFIESVAQFMRDPRYIRINGKPLLMVYRPGLLPSAKETARRWRNWCRDNEIGEIYLTYTQSFEAEDPAKYYFDAAVEFPPNNAAPPNITKNVTPLNDDFAANVYDWRVFVERSAAYKKSPYKLFRSVCPAWDNTARRKNKGNIFINNNAKDFQIWVQNAIKNTIESTSNVSERIIFVNAWNEWAEGAHLEPDQKHGYANLQGLRDALISCSTTNAQIIKIALDRKVLALVIHAHYPDVFSEIISLIDKDVLDSSRIYITSNYQNEAEIRKIISNSRINCILTILPNKGRDVLPFMKTLPQLIDDGVKVVIKVHTKKSTHRDDGDVWRKDMLLKLLSSNSVTAALNRFNDDPTVGIIGPEGHVVPMNYYWGSNANTVTKIANQLGICEDKVQELNFVAGTMFIARTAALLPLLDLGLQERDFEDENGQVDGTLAHAIERVFSISALSKGYKVAAINNLVTENFAFANRTMNDILDQE